ncbi:MAG: glycosyltransferase family 2 protein [bacterium]|nr:glycosyltransferase family 2 protein [bacterium]
MDFIFWLSVALVVYVYAGYPVIAGLLSWVFRRKVRQAEPGSFTPSVTVVIAAFNEAAHIEETVLNKLEIDYPAEKINVIVVSDESEDGTDDIVNAIDDDRVQLIRQVPRAGKTSGLNLALPETTGEIVVFSDANSLYQNDALKHLVAVFADPEVGYVTGRMVYKAPDGSPTGEGCSTYMNYENKLRSIETDLGSIVGVDGGVDAIRREIYTPMNADQLPDFVQPLTVREQGYRVVYQPAALLYEDALADTSDEFRMRVRVGLRAFHALKDKSNLLNPFSFGIFSWQLLSHKVLRYLAFLFMALAFAVNIPLAFEGGFFWPGIMAAQVLFYLTAILGHATRTKNMPAIVGLVYYLCVLNVASARAWVQFLRGRKQVIWKPRT